MLIPFARKLAGEFKVARFALRERTWKSICDLVHFPTKNRPVMKGVYRSLLAYGGKVCAVKTLPKWANRRKWDPESKERMFRPNISSILCKTLERVSAIKGRPTKLYSSHSMRDGGATPLYISKFPLDIIQRFGRWISTCFLLYFPYGNISLRQIGKVYHHGHGVSDQQLTSASARGRRDFSAFSEGFSQRGATSTTQG